MIDPEALYNEFRDDPNRIGYQIGQGVSFNDKYLPTGSRQTPDDSLKSINGYRSDIEVQVNVRSRPGITNQVEYPLYVMRAIVDEAEFRSHWTKLANGAGNIQYDREHQDIQLYMYLTQGPPNDVFAVTDELISRIRKIFDEQGWPDTRASFEALLKVNGSRAEQLFGSPPGPVGREDMLAAEEYAEKNALPSLRE